MHQHGILECWNTGILVKSHDWKIPLVSYRILSAEALTIEVGYQNCTAQNRDGCVLINSSESLSYSIWILPHKPDASQVAVESESPTFQYSNFPLFHFADRWAMFYFQSFCGIENAISKWLSTMEHITCSRLDPGTSRLDPGGFAPGGSG